MRDPELSVIVPCLDEEDNVVATLGELGDVLRAAGVESFEILVVDDASSDGTFDRSLAYAGQRPELDIRTFRRREPRRGYGAIVRHGLAHARGEYCVAVSGDGVDPVRHVPEMLRLARAGAELVQCSRYHDEAHARTIPWSYRTLQTCWRLAVRLATGRWLPDSTYAFKLFRRAPAISRGISSNGFSVGAEIFLKTLLDGGRIEYLPAAQGRRRHGKSKFFFRRELFGFSYVLARVYLHRFGILWF